MAIQRQASGAASRLAIDAGIGGPAACEDGPFGNAIMIYERLVRYGTPLTEGLFLVSTVSGVALFLGWQPGMFHEMHEILSMLLILPIVLHLWKNARPLANYFRRAAMPLAILASIAAGAVFAYDGAGNQGGNPAFAFLKAANNAPIATIAPVLGLDSEAAVARLKAGGFADATATDTPAGVAARNNVEPIAVMARLTNPAE